MNAGHIKQMTLARQLYGPSLETHLSNMDAVGVSLHTAATDLSRDCDLERVDDFLARLQAAMNLTVHIRKAIAGPRESNVQSSGTG